MTAAIRKYEILLFVTVAVVLNAGLVALAANGYTHGAAYTYGRLLLLAAVMLAVSVPARGWQATANLLQSALHWRAPPRWYVIVLLWAPATALVTLAVRFLFAGLSPQDIAFNTTVLGYPGLFSLVLFNAMICELVWIGYAFTRLSGHQYPLIAALVIGLFWTAWLLPLTAYQAAAVPGLTFAPLLLNRLGIAVMSALVFLRTGSGPCAMLLQLSFNVSILMFPVLPTTSNPQTYLLFATLSFAGALVAFFALGPRLPIPAALQVRLRPQSPGDHRI